MTNGVTLWTREAVYSMADHMTAHPTHEPMASIGQQLRAQFDEIERLNLKCSALALLHYGPSVEPPAPPQIKPRIFHGNGPDCLGCGKTLAEHLTNYCFCPGLPGDDVNRPAE